MSNTNKAPSMRTYGRHAFICTNGNCGSIPNIMREVNDLVIQDDIGYPTPGSLGTYAGWERNIPLPPIYRVSLT